MSVIIKAIPKGMLNILDINPLKEGRMKVRSTAKNESEKVGSVLPLKDTLVKGI